MRFRLRTLLAQFTIRDILWLTVIVAVAISLWLRWLKEKVSLQEENAARETKLRDDAVAERDLWKKKTAAILKLNNELATESLKDKAIANRQREISSAEIIRLEDEIRRLKAQTKVSRSPAVPAN